MKWVNMLFREDIHYSSTLFPLQFNHLSYDPDANMKYTKTFCDASGFLMFFEGIEKESWL